MDGHDWVAAAACANGVASTAVLIAAGYAHAPVSTVILTAYFLRSVQIDVLDPKRFHVYRSMVFDVVCNAARSFIEFYQCACLTDHRGRSDCRVRVHGHGAHADRPHHRHGASAAKSMM